MRCESEVGVGREARKRGDIQWRLLEVPGPGRLEVSVNPDERAAPIVASLHDDLYVPVASSQPSADRPGLTVSHEAPKAGSYFLRLAVAPAMEAKLTLKASYAAATPSLCNRCTRNDRSCVGTDALAVCTFLTSQCNRWEIAESCPDGQVCRDAKCRSRCPDGCEPGERRCVGEKAAICEKAPDGCFVWSQRACESGQVCTEGVCKTRPAPALPKTVKGRIVSIWSESGEQVAEIELDADASAGQVVVGSRGHVVDGSGAAVAGGTFRVTQVQNNKRLRGVIGLSELGNFRRVVIEVGPGGGVP